MRHEQHGASFHDDSSFVPVAIRAVKSDIAHQEAPVISKELQKKLRNEAEEWAEKKAKEMEELLEPKEDN
jgi:hypothetical protein